MTNLPNIYNFNLDELTNILKPEFPVFKIKSLFNWIYSKKITTFDNISTLSKLDRQRLSEIFEFALPEFKVFSDSQSTKLQIELEDKLIIEAVIIKERNHCTLCVSSQVGCSLGCAFCSTGKLGFTRNLQCHEIILQYILGCNLGYDIKNIVFMGMGEPLLNLDNVLKSIALLNDKNGSDIGIRRFTISTAGLINEIKKLQDLDLDLNLAISLNASTDKQRSKLMPINKKYSINKLIDAGVSYFKKTSRRVTFEYVLLKDINDSQEDATNLVDIFKNRGFHLNLIPFNKNSSEFSTPTPLKIKSFLKTLTDAGVNATVRYSKGNSIKGACGLLAGEDCDQ